MPTQRYRAVCISDVHLGIADCKVEYLLSPLQQKSELLKPDQASKPVWNPAPVMEVN